MNVKYEHVFASGRRETNDSNLTPALRRWGQKFCWYRLRLHRGYVTNTATLLLLSHCSEWPAAIASTPVLVSAVAYTAAADNAAPELGLVTRCASVVATLGLPELMTCSGRGQTTVAYTARL